MLVCCNLTVSGGMKKGLGFKKYKSLYSCNSLFFTGSGSYAKVRLGVDKITGMKVAVKQYEKLKLFDATRKKNLQRELKILE